MFATSTLHNAGWQGRVWSVFKCDIIAETLLSWPVRSLITQMEISLVPLAQPATDVCAFPRRPHLMLPPIIQ